MTLEKETSIYQLGAIAAGIEGAVSIAESKNSIFHQAEAPPTSGRKVGDIWYDSDDGFAMYKFDGTGWTQEQFGTNAISAGSVTAARLDAQDVYTNFLRVYFLSAAQAEVESLSAITANLGSVIVGGLNNEDGVITIKDASNQTIGFWDNTGINAQAGTIGPWTLGVNGLTYESEDPDDPSYVASSYGKEGFAVSNSDGGILGLGNCITCTEKSGALTSSGFEVFGSSYQSSHYANVFSIGRTSDSSGITAEINKTSGFVGIHLVDNTSNWSIDIGENRGTIEFRNSTDTPLITNIYNSSSYNILRNHNNGNISLSASGGVLHLGYENTTGINFFNGAYIFGTNYTEITNANNPVWLRVRNSASGNGIFIQSNIDGTVELASYGANGTRYGILKRANNSNAITAYGTWTFSNPIVNPSDIRLKENVKESTVNALGIINSIPVREFDWKSDGHHQAVGIIADELEKVDPGLVRGGGEDESGDIIPKGIDSMYLVGYLIKAVQELSDEVKRLKGAA